MASTIIATPPARRSPRRLAVVGMQPPAPTPAPAPSGLAKHERAVIDAALLIIEARLRSRGGVVFDSPALMKDFWRLQIGGLEHEVFAVMFLDSQHHLIEFEQMFRGTLAHTSVHPREVVKRALALNAAAVVFGHNHPSGTCEPSRADELVTHELRAALRLIDVRVLDHMVVGSNSVLSFAERELL